MWRASLMRLTFAAGGRTGSSNCFVGPYRRILQMLQTEGEGIIAAGNIFDQFCAFYRQLSFAGVAQETQKKPLEQFCGSSRDVEPFALVMMKVLCDLQKLEEMRFLFAQCILEIDLPTVELFNVYLLAISLTDSFNQYEIENVVDVMRTKGVEPDVVTQISLFIVYLRLGQDYYAWWPEIREEVLRIVKTKQQEKYPLLGVRLQHCFQTLLRVHYNVTMIYECFDLLKIIDKQKVSSRLLLPYMLLSVNNAAVPPTTTVQVIELLEGVRAIESVAVATGFLKSTRGKDTKRDSSDAFTTEPVVNNELTALKLLAKCAKWRDVTSAAFVWNYLRNNPGIISSTNQPLLSLLYLEVVARDGALQEALALLEDEIPETHCQPGPRPKLFMESRRVTLLNTDPIMTLVRRVALGDAAIEEGIALLEERRASGGNVSHKSLNVILEACALLKDDVRASMVLAAFQSFGVLRTARTFLLLLRAMSEAETSVVRLPGVLAEMANVGVDFSPEFLCEALKLAVEAQDISTALLMVDYHGKKSVSIESKLSIRLLRMLCDVIDIEGVRRLIAVLKATQSPIDSRSISLCVAAFKKWAIPCNDLLTV